MVDAQGASGEESIPAIGGLIDMKKVISGQSLPPVLVEDNQTSGTFNKKDKIKQKTEKKKKES